MLKRLYHKIMDYLLTAPHHIVWRWAAVLVVLSFLLTCWALYTLIGWLI